MLELRNVSKVVGGKTHLSDISLKLEHGTLNVLLGPTLAGKTSLMRIMAGLDVPTSGSLWFDGQDITGVPVQKRSVAMVYQQFINYPAFTVYENIASPMRVAGIDSATIDREVRKTAELLKLTPYLDRTPLNLSGGQQQRTALARAIVKNAKLVLLDEPLANLDYKLREELRAELPKLFAASGAIFVYATTEPSEALLLGGNTATLSEGRITQFGQTIDVFRQPADLITAQTFADPPLNIITIEKKEDLFHLPGDITFAVPADWRGMEDGSYVLGFQPHHLSFGPSEKDLFAMRAKVIASEITGSESYIHLAFANTRWAMLAHGIHELNAGEIVELTLDPRHLMIFDASGKSVTPRQKLAA
ncbi:ABC transporter ATP-binding protein [Phyllobacterium salinisoli]|uniref:ABC transporter ATP-binding protein n=1 Tax=Phyllobacterium salinisoli TaxID=1899321 RepID=A0A368K8Q7_9HYPH|nr:ABC transporter ATP-binding protein [Phyllobacterium salinisoli]RCS25729.1 ABC transporter ATP-binding protein [Phyllobacterium salinisoli]